MRFAEVERVVAETVASGREVGLQVAVAVDGQVVFEAAAGLADLETGRPVDPGTLFPVFSATKGIVATAAHIQAERGLLEYDRPIAGYWPAFAAGGKGAATVRHALLHQAGVPQMPPGTTVERMCDWDWMVRGKGDRHLHCRDARLLGRHPKRDFCFGALRCGCRGHLNVGRRRTGKTHNRRHCA